MCLIVCRPIVFWRIHALYSSIHLSVYPSISSPSSIHNNADHIQHLLHDPLIREIQSLQSADFQTTINQEMLYQLVASLKLKEARIVLQHLIGIQSIKSMRNSFSKWSNVTKDCNSRLMDSDKVRRVEWVCIQQTCFYCDSDFIHMSFC